MKAICKPTFTVLLVFVGATLASCRLWRSDVGGKIVVSGNIEVTQVNVAFKISGKLIDLPIREGMSVQRGAVLARLDPVQIQHQRGRDLAVLRAAQSQLVQLRTGIEYQRAALAAETELRQSELRQADVKLQELIAGSRKQEIEQAGAAVEEARSQNTQARRDWERAQVLYKNEDISTAQYDQFKARLDSSSAFLRQAEQRLALVVEGPRKEDIESARAQVERMRASLKLTEAARLEIMRKEQEIQTRQADIDRARAQVSLIESQLDDTVVVSPIDGVILVKSVEVGEVVAPATIVAVIADLDKPWLRAYIGEPDLGRVKLGAKARLTTDSHPGKTYPGRVSFISSEAEFTPKQIQTPEERVKLVYRIKIDVDNPQHELKANMPADAEIELNSKSM